MRTTKKIGLILLAAIGLQGSPASAYESKVFYSQLENAYRHMLENIQLPLRDRSLRLGAVVASPSRGNPDYFYHWTRDAGLTMLELSRDYRSTRNPSDKANLGAILQNWIQFEVYAQERALRTPVGLGEPKFTMRGDVFPFDWARPQNDGPAIRALAMSSYAFALLDEGRFDLANRLYRAELPAYTPIKRDLEFVAHHWRESGFDLWEEVIGQHFFTKMAQRAAMIQGAELARRMGDPGAADFYIAQARLLEQAIQPHLDSRQNMIRATLGPIGDTKNKVSNLDVAVVLASLYFYMGDGFLAPFHSYVIGTAQKLEASFKNIYSINWNPNLPAIGIGRYPEDVYDGVGFSQGNPWFLATAAFGELYCRVGDLRGRLYLQRVLIHAQPGGRLHEQFNRGSGFSQGAPDLTWSYVSYIRAMKACEHQLK